MGVGKPSFVKGVHPVGQPPGEEGWSIAKRRVSAVRTSSGPPSSMLSTSRKRRRGRAPRSPSPGRVIGRAVGLEPEGQGVAGDRRLPLAPASGRVGAARGLGAGRGPLRFVRAVGEDLGDHEPRAGALEDEANLAGFEARPGESTRIACRPARGAPFTHCRPCRAGPRATTVPAISAIQGTASGDSTRSTASTIADRRRGGVKRTTRPRPRLSPVGEVHRVCGSRSRTAGRQRLAVERRHGEGRPPEPAGPRRRAAGSRGRPPDLRPPPRTPRRPARGRGLGNEPREACPGTAWARAPRRAWDRDPPRRESEAGRPECARSRPGSRSRRPRDSRVRRPAN